MNSRFPSGTGVAILDQAQRASMKPLLAALLPLLMVLPHRADTVETAIIAAMRLSEQRNYSWTCSIMDDAQAYEIEGKTQDGYTWQRQPMPKTVARRLGREAGRDLESIFKAPLRYVIQTESGWKALEELPKQHRSWNNDDWYYVVVPGVRSPDMPADETELDAFGLPPAIYIPVVQDSDEEGDRVYSNAQFALALPHVELATIVSSFVDLQVEDGVAWGALTDVGAQLLLVHDGHEYIRPVIATGRFKLWMKGGIVDKYMVELAGIVVVDRKTVYVRQKSTTVVRDVGTTTVEVPHDALRRLQD
jgi:hypothetical protein